MKHKGSAIFVVACRIFSCGRWALVCGTWDLIPWPRIEPWLPALGAQSLRKSLIFNDIYKCCIWNRLLVLMAQIFSPQLWNQCIFFPQVSEISMGLTEGLGSGFCICCPQCTKLAWWHLGEEGGPRDCFACPGTGSRVELSELRLEGTLCPPALCSSRTSQERTAFVFILFLALDIYLQRTAAEWTLEQAGEGHSHPSHPISLPWWKQNCRIPSDQIQSNCCFALMRAYAFSRILSF